MLLSCFVCRDDVLHYELLQKGQFWSSTSFYGVNLSVLHQEATKACFGQCVVDAFSPSIILSDTDSLELNFHVRTVVPVKRK